MRENSINVIMQGFYGNRTFTEISTDEIDYKLQGIMDRKLIPMDYEADRTIVRIPNSKCVLVYNKHQESDTVKKNKKWFDEEGYTAKPLAYVPEENIEVYSRCLVCRMAEDGTLESIEKEDINVVFKYLAE